MTTQQIMLAAASELYRGWAEDKAYAELVGCSIVAERARIKRTIYTQCIAFLIK